MWEVSNHVQVVSFLVSVAFGALYCLAYDILRSIRRVVRSTTLAVALQDLVYFVIIAFITFMIMLAYTCGEIRLYILAALTLGFLLCNYTISRLFRRFLVIVLTQIIKLSRSVKSALKRLKFKIMRHFTPIKDFFANIFKKNLKSLKKILKRRRQVVYTKNDV